MRIMEREYEVEKRLVNWAIIIPAFMAVAGACWVVFGLVCGRMGRWLLCIATRRLVMW
jgi:hypothetical protein